MLFVWNEHIILKLSRVRLNSDVVILDMHIDYLLEMMDDMPVYVSDIVDGIIIVVLNLLMILERMILIFGMLVLFEIMMVTGNV